MMNTQKIQNMINNISRKTVQVKENNETRLAIPAPIALLIAILFTKLAVVAVLVALAMGYRFSISTVDNAEEVVTQVPSDAKTVSAAE